ncbi:hypothetical protein PCS_00787 [Desulfocurvibacter africanus PCS]|uniref:Lipoprotein n=1 Tax=Desulfocurvibacter africanus PCS TaxID=1262666 RepID=M5PWT3_DESAF|nr:hypothetical protein [Desulfocurvibacter africanus]EMG38489.1 hypothetical protein PCS_00787 [Desulfocurvibacter africanus PCS]
MSHFRLLSCLMGLMLLATSCAGMRSTGSTGGSEIPPPEQSPDTYQSTHHYYDFDDVLVPKDLKLDVDGSFVFETPQFKTGNLTFNGRVESFSVVDFFNSNLTKDGWRKHSSYKGKKSILVYEKPGKSCYISVLDESFSNTKVEVLVIEMKNEIK